MHQSVLDVFPMFTTRLEGRVPHMYLDILGLVTIGQGCLIDPVHLAVPLPFKTKKGDAPATRQQILEEFTRIKSRQNLKTLHYNYAGKLCQLYLPGEEIDRLTQARMALFEGQLLKALPDFADWPADAQFATMSMSWAMGAGFVKKWPSWRTCALERDWNGCAKNCKIREAGNPGLVPRNQANARLFKAAAQTQEPDRLTAAAVGL